MADAPTIDYSKYLFQGGPTGVWSLVGSTARPVTGYEGQLDVSKLQTRTFGEGSGGWTAQSGGGTTGGAQSFSALAPNIYAMDTQYRSQLDAYNTATNPNVTAPGPVSGGVNSIPAGQPTVAINPNFTNNVPTSSTQPTGMTSAQFANDFLAKNGREPTQAEMQAFVASRGGGYTPLTQQQLGGALPRATEAPITSASSPGTGYIRGYDSNNNYQPVWVKAGQYYPGISLSPKPSDGMTVDSLNQAKGIAVPGATGSNGATESAAMIAGAQTSISEIVKMLTPPTTEADKKQQTLLDQMASLTGELANKAADQLTAEQSAGLPQLRQKFSEINAQILSKIAEYKVLETANQNKPITMNSIIGNERAIMNARAADVGLLQALAQGLQGQIETAQNTVNRAVDLKYSTIAAQLDVRQAQLNALLPTLNREEKIQAQALQIYYDNQRQALEDQKAEAKNLTNYVLDLASKYPDAKIDILNDTPAQAQAKISSSRIYQDQVRGPVGSGGGGGSGLLGLTNQQIDNISPLVSQFQSSPIVQNYNTIGEGYNFANSLSNTTTNPADDQALIYALAKALDPGSVVREGEYATVQKYAQSLAQSYGKSVTQALAGSGFLSTEARQNIKQTINARFKAAETSYKNLYSETERRINLIGSTDKGSQLLNNYGGAFTPSSAATTPTSQPSTTNSTSSTSQPTQSWWSKTTNWLFGDN